MVSAPPTSLLKPSYSLVQGLLEAVERILFAAGPYQTEHVHSGVLEQRSEDVRSEKTRCAGQEDPLGGARGPRCAIPRVSEKHLKKNERTEYQKRRKKMKKRRKSKKKQVSEKGRKKRNDKTP